MEDSDRTHALAEASAEGEDEIEEAWRNRGSSGPMRAPNILTQVYSVSHQAHQAAQAAMATAGDVAHSAAHLAQAHRLSLVEGIDYQSLAKYMELQLPFVVLVAAIFLYHHCSVIFLCIWLGCSVHKANHILQKIVSAQVACHPAELAGAVLFVATNVALTLWLTGVQQWRALALLLPSTKVSQSAWHTAFSVVVTDSLVRCCGFIPKLTIAAVTMWRRSSGGGNGNGHISASGSGNSCGGGDISGGGGEEGHMDSSSHSPQGTCGSRARHPGTTGGGCSWSAHPGDDGAHVCFNAANMAVREPGSSSSGGGAPPSSALRRASSCGVGVPRRATSCRVDAPQLQSQSSGQPDWQLHHAHVCARRRARLLAFYDYCQAAYRALLPIPLWLSYLMRSTPNALLSSLLSASYLCFKAYGLFNRGKLLMLATRLVLRTGALYGRYLRKGEAEAMAGGEPPACPICQDPCTSPIRLDCSHVFCEDCLAEWLEREPTCPMCRCNVKPPGLSFGSAATSLLPQVF